ncbi:MAG: tRNA uridine-5-carboxymethylaminomethyl(34) synthesis GTPase MnmE, partial [Acidobacteria bacterium]|nr:tRNA uridine-5-carboxymethylaminomethyl(34) synthesis GTPase MnmE [Acidobacteriota bacterium]
MKTSDLKTIVAVATPPGYGGIGVIRLSGSESLPLIRKLLANGSEQKFVPQHASLLHLLHPETNVEIDEAV